MRLFVVLFAIGLLSGCSTLKVRPIGVPTADDAQKEIKAALDFQSESSLRFTVQIENKTGMTMVVSPSDFHLVGDGLENGQVTAIDPELVIASLNKSIEQNEEKLQTSGAELLVTMTSLVSRVSGKETSRERSERKEREELRNEEKRIAREEIASAEQKKQTYEKTFLRKTTLEPGKKLSGLVQFQTGLKEGAIGLVYKTGASSLGIAFNSRKQ